jgi:hypothetical protein
MQRLGFLSWGAGMKDDYGLWSLVLSSLRLLSLLSEWSQAAWHRSRRVEGDVEYG